MDVNDKDIGGELRFPSSTHEDNMIIRDVERDDIVDVINLAHQYMELAIDGYTLDKPVWITNVMTWLAAAENGEALFKVAYKNNEIQGFMICIGVSWHYSQDVYLDMKELFVNEDLSLREKMELVMEFTKIAEDRARELGLKGISAFSIRDNAQSYANFFCRKFGWTKAAGAKKIF